MERELQTERKMREALQEEVEALRSMIQGGTPTFDRAAGAAELTGGILGNTTKPGTFESRCNDDSHSGDQRGASDTGALLSEGLSADGSRKGEAADKSAKLAACFWQEGPTTADSWSGNHHARQAEYNAKSEPP